MRVAVVGGTGRFGSTLVWRLAEAGHHVIIGSRDASRAVNAAGLIGAQTQSGAVVEAARNRDAVASAEVVLLAVPAAGHVEMLRDIASAAAGRVVIDTCVCHHDRDAGIWVPPEEGSAAARVRRHLPRTAAVAAALHTVPARALRGPRRNPPGETLVVADSRSGLEAAVALVRDLDLRSWDAGDLAAAGALEHLACLLARLSDRHGAPAPGLRFDGLPEPGGLVTADPQPLR